jgi:drug/metabolite transporter (DMT)-like permease
MNYTILLVIGLIFATDLFDTACQLILKSSINKLAIQVTDIRSACIFIGRLIRVPRVWFGFSFSAVSLVFWLVVLSRADLNLSFSLDSMRYILIAFASAVFLKEKIDPLRWVGIFCVVAGIALVAAG